MIIKGLRVRRDRAPTRIVAHIFHGSENDAISVLQGTAADVIDAYDDCRRHGRTFAIRHFIIAPEADTSVSELVDIAKMLTTEFGADYAKAIVVLHEKARVTAAACSRHLHVLLPEVDPLNGRVLDSRHTYARHEKIAREAEARLGHRLGHGPHYEAVVQALRQEGKSDLAERLSSAFRPDPVSQEAFTHGGHQAAKRIGVDLAKVKVVVRAAWASCADRTGREAALAAHGLSVDSGSKQGEWIVTANGHFLGNLRRLSGEEPAIGSAIRRILTED